MKRLNFSCRGSRFALLLNKIDGQTAHLIESESGKCFRYPTTLLANNGFGELKEGTILDCFVHSDRRGTKKLFIYPFREPSRPVPGESIVADQIKKNALEKLGNGEYAPQQIESMISIATDTQCSVYDLARTGDIPYWRPEDSMREYKSSIDLDVIGKTLVGFYNNRGGELYLGVRDDRSTIGIETYPLNIDRIKTTIVNNLFQTVTGASLYELVDISFLDVDGHIVCRLSVPASADGSIAYFKDELYVRMEASTFHMSGRHHTEWVCNRILNHN